MQIDNKRVANLRCSEYFTQRHISQKCQLNTFEIIMNFFVNINIILKEIEWKIVFRVQRLLYRIHLKSWNIYHFS